MIELNKFIHIFVDGLLSFNDKWDNNLLEEDSLML